MSIVTSTNFAGQFKWGTAGGDAFSRADMLTGLATAIEAHDHSSGKGLAVTRVGLTGVFNENQGAAIVAANDLVLGTDGNLFVVTGNTNIRRIALTGGFQGGSVVRLLFSGTPTVSHAIASSGVYRSIVSSTGKDISIVAGDVITLVYDSTNGSWYIAGLATYGRYGFPAVQVNSSDVNVLDDYKEGSWTPVITFATPGDVAVTYSSQTARYTKIGNTVNVWFYVAASAFTWSTSAGGLKVTGLPYAAAATGAWGRGALMFQGITKAGSTFTCEVTDSQTYVSFTASVSAGNPSQVTAADLPSGGQPVLSSSLTYQTA